MNRILRNMSLLFAMVLLSGMLVACGDSGSGGGDSSSDSGGGSSSDDDGVYISLSDAPPRNLTATAQSSSSVQLAWDSPLSGTATGYFVYRAGGGSYFRVSSFGITNTTGPSNTYADPNLTEDTRYCYKVSSYNSSGTESQLSAEACATTLSNPGIATTYPSSGDTNIPVALPSITVTFEDAMDTTTITTDTFQVVSSSGDTSGTAVDGTVSYDITNKVATFAPSGNLAYGVKYTVTLTTGVKTLAGVSLEEPGWVFSFTTEIDAPAGLTATASVDVGGGIVLSWTAPTAPNVSYYNIYRRPINENYGSTPLNSDQTTAVTSYPDTTAVGGTFCYYMTAVDASQNESEPDHDLTNAEPPVGTIDLTYPYCQTAP